MGILLQILEEGTLTDNWGRAVDFRNTVVIMTSNAGADRLQKEGALGFGARDSGPEHKEIKSSVMAELKKIFKPEFLNRVDETIVFHQLSKSDLIKILDIQMKEIGGRLEDRRITLELTGPAKEYLVDKSYDETLGARPLRRSLERYLEDPLAEQILRGDITNGVKVKSRDQERRVDFYLHAEHDAKKYQERDVEKAFREVKK